MQGRPASHGNGNGNSACGTGNAAVARLSKGPSEGRRHLLMGVVQHLDQAVFQFEALV